MKTKTYYVAEIFVDGVWKQSFVCDETYTTPRQARDDINRNGVSKRQYRVVRVTDPVVVVKSFKPVRP